MVLNSKLVKERRKDAKFHIRVCVCVVLSTPSIIQMGHLTTSNDTVSAQ